MLYVVQYMKDHIHDIDENPVLQSQFERELAVLERLENFVDITGANFAERISNQDLCISDMRVYKELRKDAARYRKMVEIIKEE